MSLTQGIVIGTRKAGTTWLYENFRRDPRISVSEVVKESGFFTGEVKNLTYDKYQALFDAAAPGQRVEVDSSVCYADAAAELIERYHPKMRVVLVFRDPVSFLRSRHVHSLRKGELAQSDPLEALQRNHWLQRELDYPAIVARFARFERRGTLTILAYEDMISDPLRFYEVVVQALGIEGHTDFLPDVEPVNVSRSSRLRVVSAAFSQGAIVARRLGLHQMVNSLKSTGVHKLFEVRNDNRRTANGGASSEEEAFDRAVAERVPASVALHRALRENTP